MSFPRPTAPRFQRRVPEAGSAASHYRPHRSVLILRGLNLPGALRARLTAVFIIAAIAAAGVTSLEIATARPWVRASRYAVPTQILPTLSSDQTQDELRSVVYFLTAPSSTDHLGSLPVILGKRCSYEDTRLTSTTEITIFWHCSDQRSATAGALAVAETRLLSQAATRSGFFEASGTRISTPSFAARLLSDALGVGSVAFLLSALVVVHAAWSRRSFLTRRSVQEAGIRLLGQSVQPDLQARELTRALLAGSVGVHRTLLIASQRARFACQEVAYDHPDGGSTLDWVPMAPDRYIDGWWEHRSLTGGDIASTISPQAVVLATDRDRDADLEGAVDALARSGCSVLGVVVLKVRRRFALSN